MTSDDPPRIYRLLMQLRERGGAIVPSSACSDEELSAARLADRFTIDADGYGYVYLPERGER